MTLNLSIPTIPKTPLDAPAGGRRARRGVGAAAHGRRAQGQSRRARPRSTWSATLPAFRRRVQELRAEMTSRALGRLVNEMASAAATLGHLSRKGKSEMVRLGAARAVLELGHEDPGERRT